MGVTLEQDSTRCVLRMEGQVNLSSAPELKTLLLQCLSAGHNPERTVELDLDRADEIDVTILQLLYAAGGEAARTGVQIALHASDAVLAAAREAGFDQDFPFQK